MLKVMRQIIILMLLLGIADVDQGLRCTNVIFRDFFLLLLSLLRCLFIMLIGFLGALIGLPISLHSMLLVSQLMVCPLWKVAVIGLKSVLQSVLLCIMMGDKT